MSRLLDRSAAMRSRTTLLATTAVGLLVAMSMALAQEPGWDLAPEPTIPTAEPAIPARPAVPLLSKDVDLTGSAAELVVPFVLPPDEPFDRATLDVTYSNALAVLPDHSGMDVSLNGKTLTKLPLVGAQGAAAAAIDLPASSFKPGRNELRFQVHQSHRLACSLDRFGELWTKLKTTGTSLSLHRQGERLAIEPAGVTGFLASSMFDGEPFGIATGRSQAGLKGLELGSRVAQAVALVRGDRPQAFQAASLSTIDWSTLKDRNVALIGNVDELGELLGPGDQDVLRAQNMVVRRLPADPDHVALLFAGTNDKAIAQAVGQFAGSATRPLDPPPLVELDGQSQLKLSDLGFRTRELPLGSNEPIRMQFRLPPTFYAADGQRLDLALNYAYAAGLAATSAMTVQVNDIPANLIRLGDPNGRIVDGAKVNLTLGMFHPGINTIAIQPVLDPASEQLCQEQGPILSLFDDSKLTMPEFARLAHGGDLHDLVDDGFPYGDEPADVLVSARDPDAVGAAFTLLGKLAQRKGEILGKLGFAASGTTSTNHLIAIGTPTDLAPSLLARLDLPSWQDEPVETGPVAAVATVPVAKESVDPRDRWKSRIGEESDDGAWWQRLRRMAISAADADVSTPVPVRPSVPAAPGSGGTMLVEVESPWAAKHIATVLVADRPEHLAPGLAALTEEPRWTELGGDRAQWRAGPNDVVGERRYPPFALSAPEDDAQQWRLAVLTWLAQNRWTWLGLMLGGLLIASMTTSVALRLRRH